MISRLLEVYLASARSNERPFGFMSLMTDVGAVSGTAFTKETAENDFFAKTGARVRGFAAELRHGDYDFMDLMEDQGFVPNLYALTGISSVVAAANDTIGVIDEPAPKSPAAPKAA